MSRDLAEWPPLVFGSLLETRNWKRKGVTKKETEGGCPRLVHAEQRFVLYLMEAHGNLSRQLCVRLSVLYHRESLHACFSITHTLTRPFCSWEKNYDPHGLLAASPDCLHSECCVWLRRHVRTGLSIHSPIRTYRVKWCVNRYSLWRSSWIDWENNIISKQMWPSLISLWFSPGYSWSLVYFGR